MVAPLQVAQRGRRDLRVAEDEQRRRGANPGVEVVDRARHLRLAEAVDLVQVIDAHGHHQLRHEDERGDTTQRQLRSRHPRMRKEE